jgi:hypothetical protein
VIPGEPLSTGDPSALPGDVEFRLQTANLPRPSDTTAQQDLTTEGQRRVNLIWEHTQSVIALVVVASAMVAGVYQAFKIPGQIPTILSVAFGTVVGFYFNRTNHSAIGGVGPRPPESPYVGR